MPLKLHNDKQLLMHGCYGACGQTRGVYETDSRQAVEEEGSFLQEWVHVL